MSDAATAASSAQRHADALFVLLQSTVRAIKADPDPFSGMLEAPSVVAELYSRHAPGLSESARRLRAEASDLADELVGLVWGVEPGATITAESLRERGFDPDAPMPDEDDYW
jgi:hypothetical protein